MSFVQQDHGIVTDCETSFTDTDGKRKTYKWYSVWKNMLRRCYDKKNKNYQYYGAKGVCVSEELKIASIFRDWYTENNPNGDLVMDKDTICEERGICPKYYGKDTIIFISIHDNCSESSRRRWGWNGKDKISKIKPHNKQNRDVKIRAGQSSSETMEYYETKGIKRGHFKTICKRQGWNFDDFIEIDSGERYYTKDGRARDKKYYYFYKYK